MWIAEKFQSNPEIAGSPRNSFRASPGYATRGGRALNSRGGVKACRRISNSECRALRPGVRLYEISWTVERETAQTAGQGPKGRVKWQRMWGLEDNQDVGSEAATHSKSA